MFVYHNIVSLESYADAMVERFMHCNISEDTLIDYLSQWDYGSEMEHSPDADTGAGTMDEVHIKGEGELQDGAYILVYNRALGYASLIRVGLRDD